jgi:thymidylate synthase (FAD)
MNKIDVLDKGYVRLVNVMGSDLTVANAARVSFDKESFKMSDKDERLIRYLAKHGHTSPFRHAMLQFEVYSPLMVARQHYKYLVGSSFQEGSNDSSFAWNESSRRYITEEPAFYIPKQGEWRTAPENSKQGSGEPLATDDGQWTAILTAYAEEGLELYEQAMREGICAEQARLFLPAYGMYVRYYWTASLQSVAHFLNQRLAHDAQVEIQAYARAVHQLVEPHFPVSIAELLNG